MTAKAENKRFINSQAINLKSFMKGEARRKKEKTNAKVSCSIRNRLLLLIHYCIKKSKNPKE